MVEVEKEQNKVPRALLVGEPGNNLLELKGLVQTLGIDIVQRLTLNRMEVHPQYGIGTGKAKEIAELAKQIEVDCIIFDFNIEPRKQRNWEELTGLSCFDRQEVIIKIFAQRATTKEAVLQVELARLSYMKPRLAHAKNDFSRQRGGAFGAKGSGETQLELDQRLISEKIAAIKHDLAEIEVNRKTQRKQREKNPTCALVGYTNAGKSSLLNIINGNIVDYQGIIKIGDLDIKNITVNIKDAVDAEKKLVLNALKEIGKNELTEQTIINLPPRIRMATLYAVSQTVNGRVINTCNLSEDWVGYSTRYGDSAGDVSPLANLTVNEVKQLGIELGLPRELVYKTPSDGLCGKSDEDNLGFTYATLDNYLRTGECEDEEIKKIIDRKHTINKFKLELMPSYKYGEVKAKR